MTAHASVADELAAHLAVYGSATPVTQQQMLLRMCEPCWRDACHDCYGGPCLCACNDGPPRLVRAPQPAAVAMPPRCGGCGYLVTAPGHEISCGRARLEAATAEYYGRTA